MPPKVTVSADARDKTVKAAQTAAKLDADIQRLLNKPKITLIDKIPAQDIHRQTTTTTTTIKNLQPLNDTRPGSQRQQVQSKLQAQNQAHALTQVPMSSRTGRQPPPPQKHNIIQKPLYTQPLPPPVLDVVSPSSESDGEQGSGSGSDSDSDSEQDSENEGDERESSGDDVLSSNPTSDVDIEHQEEVIQPLSRLDLEPTDTVLEAPVTGIASASATSQFQGMEDVPVAPLAPTLILPPILRDGFQYQLNRNELQEQQQQSFQSEPEIHQPSAKFSLPTGNGQGRTSPNPILTPHPAMENLDSDSNSRRGGVDPQLVTPQDTEASKHNAMMIRDIMKSLLTNTMQYLQVGQTLVDDNLSTTQLTCIGVFKLLCEYHVAKIYSTSLSRLITPGIELTIPIPQIDISDSFTRLDQFIHQFDYKAYNEKLTTQFVNSKKTLSLSDKLMFKIGLYLSVQRLYREQHHTFYQKINEIMTRYVNLINEKYRDFISLIMRNSLDDNSVYQELQTFLKTYYNSIPHELDMKKFKLLYGTHTLNASLATVLEKYTQSIERAPQDTSIFYQNLTTTTTTTTIVGSRPGIGSRDGDKGLVALTSYDTLLNGILQASGELNQTLTLQLSQELLRVNVQYSQMLRDLQLKRDIIWTAMTSSLSIGFQQQLYHQVNSLLICNIVDDQLQLQESCSMLLNGI
jgi:hypothetical protein